MKIDETIETGFCVKANTSVQMGGIVTDIDEDGKEKNVYSWRLDKNDPTPKGKKRELSLREKEKQIQADLFDHIVTRGGNYTVVELVEKYVSLKTGVTHNTRAGYKTVINILN